MNAQEILTQEGFPYIYKWHDEAGTQYPAHAHQGKVTIFVQKGNVTFSFSDGRNHTVSTGERFDVPVGVEHSAIVGFEGCDYIVGEMIDGDS